MDTVFIRGLRAQAVIGCYDHERTIRQPLIIDLELATDVASGAATDQLEHALDYAGDIPARDCRGSRRRAIS